MHYEIPQEKVKESMLQTSARMCFFHNAAYDGIVLPPVLSWENTFRFTQYNRFKSFVNTNGHFFLSPCVSPCFFWLCWMLIKNKNKIKAFAAVALQWAESRLKAFPKPLCWYNWSGSSRVHRVPAFKQARCIASTCKFLLYFFTFWSSPAVLQRTEQNFKLCNWTSLHKNASRKSQSHAGASLHHF